MSVLRQGKDRLLSKGVRSALNLLIRDYGRMTDFAIDSGAADIRCEVMLEGEREALRVDIYGYGIIEQDGRHYLTFERLDTSRAWINTLLANELERVLPGRRIEIPPEVARVLTVIA